MGDIEEHEDGFYFWDEYEEYDFGPFDKLEQASAYQYEYFRTLEDN